MDFEAIVEKKNNNAMHKYIELLIEDFKILRMSNIRAGATYAYPNFLKLLALLV